MPKTLHAPRIGVTAKLSPCVSGFVLSNERNLLLVRRTDNGLWCLPGGRIEPGEGVAEACIREVREETGLEMRVERLLGVWSDPDMILEYPDGNRWQCLEIDLLLTVVGGSLLASDETSECRYFSLRGMGNIPLMDSEKLRICKFFDWVNGVEKEPYVK